MWQQIIGELKSISCGNANHVWGVNEKALIYRRKGEGWENIEGGAYQVSVGADGEVWAIVNDNKIFRLVRRRWKQIQGELMYISVGSIDNVWGVNVKGEIFQYTGNEKAPWKIMPGTLSSVSVGSDGEVWGVHIDVEKYGGIRPPTQFIPGLGLEGSIYRRVGDGWKQIPGSLSWISVGSKNDVWGINKDGAVFKYSGNETAPWIKTPGTLSCVSAGSDGSVWGTDNKGNIYRYFPDVTWMQKDCRIKYDDQKPPVTRKDVIMERHLENLSNSAAIEESMTYDRSRTATYEWGLTKSFSMGSKVGFEATVPFGSLSGEVSVEIELGSHQTWSTTETQELSITDTVTVPAGERIVLRSCLHWADNVVTPFTLNVRLSGKSKDITIPEVYQADSLDEIELSGDQIKWLVLQTNPDAKITTVSEKEVDLELSGMFTGSYAINTSTSIKPQD